MNNLFNKSFFRFTIGFVGILLLSFAFASIVTKMEESKATSASVSGGR